MAAGIVTLCLSDGPDLTADPEGTFWAGIRVDGFDSQDKVVHFIGDVNAVTGDVRNLSGAWGAGVPAKSPRALDSSDYVPVRGALPGKSYVIHWDGANKQLRAAKGLKQVIVLQVGSKKALVNGKSVTLQSAPRIVSDRMMLSSADLGILR